MMKNKLNIFVTGGAGYIGSHACKLLSAAGYNPIAIDSLVTGWREAVKFGPFEQIDLCDKKRLDLLFKKYKPEGVFHFAGLSQVGESVREPGKYWRNNVTGTLSLVEACVENQCFDFVFSSTCAIYGETSGALISENSPQKPTNAYSASKRASEEILVHFSEISNLNYVVFRYFNVAGADPDGELGEFHRPETHLIPSILDAAMGKREAITIFGTDYDTPDGTCIRDYVHVIDLVEAHLLGFEMLKETGLKRIYNLGTGIGYSVREVIDAVKLVTGLKVPEITGVRREGDCARLVSCSQLVYDELGWAPKKSEILKIIKDAWLWHSNSGYSF